MNRIALGLAVGAGYILGRTKKMKLAFAVGTMVAGKRLKLSPKALAELVSTQLEKNPQFKGVGDQLRQDLRGVGTAASGALVERQLEGLAGRLHSRTQGVQDRIAGVTPDADDVRGAGDRVTGVVRGRKRRGEDDSGEDAGEDGAHADGEEYEDERDTSDERGDAQSGGRDEDESGARNKKPSADGRAAAPRKSTRTTKSATAKSSTARSASAKTGAAKTGAAKKTPAKKSAAKRASGGGAEGGGGGSASRAPRAAKKATGSATRTAKGGRDHG
ncbi:DNA primase [Streptomyces sp. NPDC006552]|uniref:DNA primase n=1 Tax=Streptomyces sp. NPDC006552 TaxID=3157179 RepID=UPI0033B2BFAE